MNKHDAFKTMAGSMWRTFIACLFAPERLLDREQPLSFSLEQQASFAIVGSLLLSVYVGLGWLSLGMMLVSMLMLYMLFETSDIAGYAAVSVTACTGWIIVIHPMLSVVVAVLSLVGVYRVIDPSKRRVAIILEVVRFGALLGVVAFIMLHR